MGELIVYQWLCPPSIHRQSIHPSIICPIHCVHPWSGHPLYVHQHFLTSSEPTDLKLHMETLWGAWMNVCSNGPGHMIKMATTAIYGKTPLKIFFCMTRRPGPPKLDLVIYYCKWQGCTKFIKTINLGWPWPTIWQGKVCFLMHLIPISHSATFLLCPRKLDGRSKNLKNVVEMYGTCSRISKNFWRSSLIRTFLVCYSDKHLWIGGLKPTLYLRTEL